MNEVKATLYSLVPKDYLKAAIMAGMVAGAKLIYTAVDAGAFPTTVAEWKSIGLAAIGTAGMYLLKNFLTNSDDKFLKKEATNASN
ncbi:MAG: hypothetical protein V4538_16195 [Bacteroidota bacterium]